MPSSTSHSLREEYLYDFAERLHDDMAIWILFFAIVITFLCT